LGVGLSGRDSGLGFLLILLPVVAGLPFLVLALFLFLARPWSRRALVVLLTLALVPFASIVGGEVGSQSSGLSDFGVPFIFLAAVLALTVSPWTRKAFGRSAGLWWLEAGLAALPVLWVFSTNMIEMRPLGQKKAAQEQKDKDGDRDGTELTRLLQTPESPETDTRIGQLISAGASSYTWGTGEMAPLALAAKNHPHVLKALLDGGAKPPEPIVWKYVAEGGRFDLLPEVARTGIRPDPKVGEQFGMELIRMIREGRNDPGYRERVTGLIRGGADLTVSDQGHTALEEAVRTGQTEIANQLREQMELPAPSPVSGRLDEVAIQPRVSTFVDSGPCPRTVVITADFGLFKAETVRYRFIDEATLALPDTHEFKAGGGSNTITLKRVIGGDPGKTVYGWVQFELITGKLQLTTAQSPFAVVCR
jgi:hypothetical protein